MSFSFIHTYMPGIFPALEASGLWRGGDGLKMMHKPSFTPPDDFNSAAAKDGALARLLFDLGCRFYVDRLQGGIGFTRKYPYDAELLKYYRDLPDGRFLGFQMHEWASNFASDLGRIRASFAADGLSPDAPADAERFWREVKAGEREVFLEEFAPEEYAEMRLPEGLAEFLRAAEALYALRARETGGRLFPADSYYMAPRAEIAHGARLLLPECGWQIPNMRVQIAYTRGMAKAAGIPWGIYWECWQNTADAGFTIPFSLRKGQDEWLEDLLHKGAGSDRPPEEREHGGSSLSLAERAWRFAYFSGAETVAEEYGVCNTFRDPATAELSPYGEMKRSFLRFTEAFPDLGNPYTPIAVVLPAELPMLDIRFADDYLGFPTDDPACPAVMRAPARFRAAAEEIFGDGDGFGNCGHVLKSGGLPAVCDIVHADMEDALSGYEYLIDLTGDPSFAVRHKNTVAPAGADRLLDGLLPLRVGGGLCAAYNRRGDEWYILLMNNNGVRHDGFRPDEFRSAAAVTQALRLRDPTRGVRMAAGTGTLSADGGAYTVSLPAGAWLLLQTS
ncbi:MAG: hypothetical protein IK118_00650 [Clostridia bacterium]|nr:hypothetical protein [Clostridia bacterium]